MTSEDTGCSAGDTAASGATVYFDHAATSWPKPPEVVESVVRSLTEVGGSPGRAAHRLGLEVSREIYSARAACASLLGVTRSKDLIFTRGCTESCNLMLKGVLRPGDRVVVGSMEHNSVARPLAVLAARGVDVVKVMGGADGRIDPDAIAAAVGAAPTRAVVCQHVSNVTGTIQPIAEIARIAHKARALMLVDGAQGAGHLEVDVERLGVDAYAISGHKGMLGPQGVGLLYLHPELEVEGIVEGGTGGGSETAEMPTSRPDRYEAGTPNTPGILGLGAAATYLVANGAAQGERERQLTRRLLEGIVDLGGYRVFGPSADVARGPVVSVVPASGTPSELAAWLDREHSIACRAGLHCAPWAHETIGTRETGTCRFGLGYGLNEGHVDMLLAALAEFDS